jgi:hydroxylamine reductase
MIAAHGYPAFKKYFNLVGNYGGAWQDQKNQFGKFQGPVLVTSNSLQQPKKGYTAKAYTSGMVGFALANPGDPENHARRPECRAYPRYLNARLLPQAGQISQC